jgi:hypothetical protein
VELSGLISLNWLCEPLDAILGGVVHCYHTSKSVIQYTRNSYTLQLNDKQETMIPLSKQSEKELQELLGGCALFFCMA